MGRKNNTRNNTGDRTPEQEAIAPAHSDPVTAFQSIDLKGIANFAALKGELLLAEHEIFDGEAPDTFAKVRNRVIARLTRQGKAGIATGLDLIELKAVLKADNDWVRYGTLIAKAMGLSSVSALNHIIRRTEHAAKLPKRLLSAMIEQGLEPIDGHNSHLVTNLIDWNFSGTRNEAATLVREEYDRITQAKREARMKNATKRAKRSEAGLPTVEYPGHRWDEALRDCPDGERMAFMETMVTKLNSEIELYLPGHKLQLVPIEDAARDKQTDEPNPASLGREKFVQPVVTETRTDVLPDEDVDLHEDHDIMEDDEDFPLYPRMTIDQQTTPLQSGDRSALARRIIETHGRDIEAVLKDLRPNEQAQILEYCYQQITQSCCPAVRLGSAITTSAEYIAPPLQARKGEPLDRTD